MAKHSVTSKPARSRGWLPLEEDPMSALFADAAARLAKFAYIAIPLNSTIIIALVGAITIRKG